jgi:hypothetical protein
VLYQNFSIKESIGVFVRTARWFYFYSALRVKLLLAFILFKEHSEGLGKLLENLKPAITD